MTRFVYFDLGNVLLHFDHGRACRQMSDAAGVPTALVRSVVFDEMQDDYECGRLSTRQFYERFCERTQTSPDYETLLRAASDIFELNHAILPVVTQLRAAGYRLGILSNTNEAHWEHVRRVKLPSIETMFGEHVLSYRAGSMKPAAAIYEHAIDRSACDARQLLFIDDRPDNVAGAIQSGIAAIKYESASQVAHELRGRGLRFNY